MIIETENLDVNVKKIIDEELPKILESNPEVKLILWKKLINCFADKKETESKFEIMLRELKELKKESEKKWELSEKRWKELKEESDKRWEEFQKKWKELKEESDKRWEESQRKWKELKEESDKRWEESQKQWKELKEESERKWKELKEESERKWKELKEESDKKWKELKEESERKWKELKEESDTRWESLLKEVKRVDKRIDKTIGALGSRWGLNTEKAFRDAIRDILTELTGMKVERYLGYDNEGEVFGHPDQIELDVVLKNGKVYVIEIKSSVSKAEMYAFDRKVKFYEKQTGKKVDKKIVISPMIEKGAYEVANKLGIKAYREPEDLAMEEDRVC